MSYKCGGNRLASFRTSKLRRNNRMSHHFWSEAYFRLVLKTVSRPTLELLSCHTRCSTSPKQVISGLLTCPFSLDMLSDHSVRAIRTSQLTFQERQKEYFIALGNKVNQSDNMKQLVILFHKERSNFIKLSQKYVGYKYHHYHHHFRSVYIIFFSYYK